MARRRHRRAWHIGDRVRWRHWAHWGGINHEYWSTGTVTAVRDDQVVLTDDRTRRDTTVPLADVRPRLPHRGLWRRWWGHGTRRRNRDH